MKEQTKVANDGARMPGIHKGGRSEFLEVSHRHQRFREEKAKLRRRLSHFCKPCGIIGKILVFRRRRELTRKLRYRFEVPYALFIGGARGSSR